MNELSSFVNFVGFRDVGLRGGFEPVSGFGLIFVVFLVEFIPLARIDGIVLIVNRFGAFGGRVQRQEHCGVEI